MPDASTTRDLRLQNRARVLRGFLAVGTTTRANLAALTGLSPATVTTLVNDLLAEGLVTETGSLPSRGGRPTIQLELDPTGAYFLGADIGERGVTVELFDLRLNRVDRERRESSTRTSGSAELAEEVADAVRALRDRNAALADRIVGMGLALPGIVEGVSESWRVGESTVLYAQNLGWPAVGVRELAALDDLPLYADNGAKTMTSAEMLSGAASDCTHALVALLGGGIGLGVVADGRLVRGAESSAGEWGHTKIVPPSDPAAVPCSCGAKGCLEAYVGEDGMLRRWAALGARVPGTGWDAVRALLDAARSGDEAAATVVDESIELIGTALGNLVNLVNPEAIVLGGRVGLRLMQDWAPELRRRVDAAALDRPGRQCELRSARYGRDAIALGAALLPLNALIDDPAMLRKDQTSRDH